MRFRRWVPAGILLIGCALLWSAHRQRAIPIEQPLASILAHAAGFQVVEQTIPADEQLVAGMTEYVARTYRRDSVVAFTTFVSYYDKQTQGKTIHSPRNCLPGAGWEIVSGGLHAVSSPSGVVTVNRFLLKNGASTAVAYYWYQGRGRVTANEYLVKLNLLRDAALRGRTEEALVRLVIPVRDSAATAEGFRSAIEAADVQAGPFLERLVMEVDRVLPRVG
jgi:EpsI family protein